MDYIIKHATNEYELKSILSFAEKIFGNHEIFNYQCWFSHMKVHPELLFYAESEGKVIGITPSYLENNGNITIGFVAVDKEYRKCGIAKALIAQVEKEAKKLDVHLLALGSVESAEGFYERIGFTGQLLIQSEKHTINELLALNPGYPVVFTNVYDGKINQICLKLNAPDRKLQKLYESTLEKCYTQTMFWKKI